MSGADKSTAARLVGRNDDVALTHELIAAGRRLITITGPPGVGKTALLRRLSEDLDGSEWVGLLDEPSVSKLRGALEQEPSPPWLLVDDVGIAPKSVELLEAYLGTRPQGGVVCTSRRRLRLADEQLVQLAPLGLPARGARPAAIAQSPAGELFLERAQRVWPAFALETSNAESVVDLLWRLDGLPLAIELAASRLNMMDVDSLRRELETSNDVLQAKQSGGAYLGLEARIERSWHQLRAVEQAALASLSVLEADFSLEAACALIDGEEPALETLQELVDASLLVVQPGRTSRRFRILQSIGTFARRCAEAESLERAKRRVGAFFSTLARRHVDQLHRACGAQALAHLADERIHFEALLDAPASFALEPDDIVECLLAVNIVYGLRGSPAGWRDALDDHIASLQAQQAAPNRIAELRLRSVMWRQARRHVAPMIETIAEVVEVARQTDDLELEMRALLYGAQFKLGPRSHEWLQAAEELMGRHTFDEAIEVRLGMCRGHVATMQGDTDGARRGWHEALERARQISDGWMQATLQHLLGMLDIRNDLGEARRQLLAAAEDYAKVGLDANRRAALLSLANALVRYGHPDEAEPVLAEAETLAERQGLPVAAVSARVLRAEALIDVRRFAEAKQIFERAWDDAITCKSAALQAQCAVGLASLALIDEDAQRAQQALDRLHKDIDGYDAEISAFLRARIVLVEACVCAAGGEVEAASKLVDQANEIATFDNQPLLEAIAEATELLIEVARGDEPLARLAKLRASDSLGQSNWARMAFATLSARLSPQVMRLLDVVQQTPSDALLVAAELRCCRTPEGDWHDLSARAVPWRFLWAVASRRAAFQDEHTDSDIIDDTELVEQAWPDQQVTVDAASNRVYVTVSALRKLGLKDHLERIDNGYRLTCRVVLSEANDTPATEAHSSSQ